MDSTRWFIEIEMEFRIGQPHLLRTDMLGENEALRVSQTEPNIPTAAKQDHSVNAMPAPVSPALRTIAQVWPRDAFRPFQFSTVLETLSESTNLRVRAVMAARALSENRLKAQVRIKYMLLAPVGPRCLAVLTETIE